MTDDFERKKLLNICDSPRYLRSVLISLRDGLAKGVMPKHRSSVLRALADAGMWRCDEHRIDSDVRDGECEAHRG